MHTAARVRIPAWQRRASVILLPALVVAATGCLRYLQGGGRVDQSGFGVSAPLTVGEEFHAIAPLGASGEIEVLDVRPVGVSGPVVVEVRLLLETGNARHWGSARGPLATGVVVLPLPSPGNALRVDTGGTDAIYSLDLRMIGTAAGVARVGGVKVTYRAGLLRQRTARVSGAVCLEVSIDRTGHLSDGGGACAGERP